eukprot:scaffold6348_cov259-Pinguiococcus_pyrenoidosus.AAC.17
MSLQPTRKGNPHDLPLLNPVAQRLSGAREEEAAYVEPVLSACVSFPSKELIRRSLPSFFLLLCARRALALLLCHFDRL